MRRLSLFMHITLDGFIARPGGELDDLEPSVEEHEYANDLFETAGAVLFGRRAYEGFVEYWDALDLTDPTHSATELRFARIFRRMKRVVFSRTLATVDSPAELIGDGIAGSVNHLKRQPGGDLLLVCGPELLATLAQDDLVDEYRLLVHPLALGQGVSLFGRLTEPLRLELIETRAFQSGTILHRSRLLRRGG
jgi:dihydrofolate reductase